MKISDNADVVKLILISLEDNSEKILFERQGSRCHFNDEIHYKDYIISLRIDWDNINYGEPTLDADIWRKPKSKRTRLKNGSWHHTEKTFDVKYDMSIYKFRFEDLELNLTTKKSIAITLTSDAVIVNDNMDSSI